VRVEREGTFELLDGLGEEARLAVGAADEHAQLRAVAELRGHALEDGARGRELPLLEVGEAERVGHVVVARRELERHLKLGRRALELAEHEEALAEHVVRRLVARVAREGATEGFERALVLPRVEVSDGERDKRLGRVGRILRGRLAGADLRLVVGLGRVDAAQFAIALGEDGAELGLGFGAAAGAAVRLGRLVVAAEGVAG
jgi:hypothetical protein